MPIFIKELYQKMTKNIMLNNNIISLVVILYT